MHYAHLELSDAFGQRLSLSRADVIALNQIYPCTPDVYRARGIPTQVDPMTGKTYCRRSFRLAHLFSPEHCLPITFVWYSPETYQFESLLLLSSPATGNCPGCRSVDAYTPRSDGATNESFDLFAEEASSSAASGLCTLSS